MAISQPPVSKYDSSYYIRFRNKIIISPFIVEKNNSFTIIAPDAEKKIRYRDYNPTELGVRLGFDFLALDISVGAGFLDGNHKKSLETKNMGFKATFTP